MSVVMCAWTFKNLECCVFVDLKGLEVFPLQLHVFASFDALDQFWVPHKVTGAGT